MRLRIAISVLLLLSAPLCAQRVVDRIVAIIEEDVITLSEVRELGRYQVLVGGRQESSAAAEAELLSMLIDQWIVANEARTARFPRPETPEVDRAMERLTAQAGGPAAWEARLRELELRPAAVRAILERQLWLTRYLEYKFRPAAQIEPAELEKYYREELAPRLTSNGGVAPALASVEEQIRELLIQRDITQRASRWLAESKSRLKIELHNGGKGD